MLRSLPHLYMQFRFVLLRQWKPIRLAQGVCRMGHVFSNPIFVLVGGKPIRASKKSAEWCLKSVDQCWSKKEPAIRASEKEAARRAYEVAREAYRKILAESQGD